MVIATLRKELETRKRQIGLVGTRLDLSEVAGNSLSAHITQDWNTISIQYGENLKLVPNHETTLFAEKRRINQPELKVGLDLLEHEAGHRENPSNTKLGCPYTVEMHDAIKESIYRALAEKGKTGLEDYVTNAFEDVLDNVNCRRNTDFSGQTLFWNNQGLTNSQNGKYSFFYEAFVRLNLIIGGSVPDQTLLRRFYTNDNKVKEAVQKFLGDVKSQLGIEHAVKLHQKAEFKTLFTSNLTERERLWTKLAYSFALHTADLLEQTPTEAMFGSDDNPFDKEMRLPKTKQGIAYKRYQEGKGPATHRDLQDQLYDLYRRISKDIPVETSSYSDSQSMPLVHYGRRFVHEDEQKFKFRGIGIKEDGSLGLRTTKHTLQFPVAYKVHPRKFPKFKLALMDRSGSMSLNSQNEHADGKPINIGNTSFIPWGDNSKYHYALKGYFGIENFLERQGVGDYIESCVLGFSGEQAVAGKARDVAKSLLTTPSGGTAFDIDGLEKELSEDALVLSISDGELSLTDDVKRRFESKMKQSRVDYAHVQIGQNTAFSEYLRGLGIPVFTVNGDNDLARTMITFVSGYYRAPIGELK